MTSTSHRNGTQVSKDFARYTRHYRPEVAERITDIPAETIRSLAHEIVSSDGDFSDSL